MKKHLLVGVIASIVCDHRQRINLCVLWYRDDHSPVLYDIWRVTNRETRRTEGETDRGMKYAAIVKAYRMNVLCDVYV